MKRFVQLLLILLFSASFLMLSSCGEEQKGGGHAKGKMMKPPFGTKADVADAKSLWKKIKHKRYIRAKSKLYYGTMPHGTIRQAVKGKISGRTIVLKNNYGGKGVTIKKPSKKRIKRGIRKVKRKRSRNNKYLKAITVMYKREAGYDSKNGDWFWAKYKRNGSLHKVGKGPMKGMPMAGRLKGCIMCHKGAGKSMIFKHGKKNPMRKLK